MRSYLALRRTLPHAMPFQLVPKTSVTAHDLPKLVRPSSIALRISRHGPIRGYHVLLEVRPRLSKTTPPTISRRMLPATLALSTTRLPFLISVIPLHSPQPTDSSNDPMPSASSTNSHPFSRNRRSPASKISCSQVLGTG